jgi:hypothetical protein
MNLLIQLLPLLEQGIPLAISAYKQLEAAGQTTVPLADLLAQANANADAVIATAQAELKSPAV